MTIRIITWNIGCISFLKFFKFLNIKYKGQKITHEYFQAKINGEKVSKFLEKMNPEIIFLQEIYSKKDLQYIHILKKYPYQTFINTWYHKHSILVASKKKIKVLKNEKFSSLLIEKINFIPIHLNSFSAKKRLRDSFRLKKMAGKNNKTIILGDTNIWSRRKIFLFKNDKKAYEIITKHLLDFTYNIKSTSILGFSLDKVFGSKNILLKKIEVEKERGAFMDHYPVILEIEVK